MRCMCGRVTQICEDERSEMWSIDLTILLLGSLTGNISALIKLSIYYERSRTGALEFSCTEEFEEKIERLLF